MSDDLASVEAEVARIVLRVLALPPGRYEKLERESIPEWDSLKHMEVVFNLEDSFGVVFDEAEFPALSSPGAIAALIVTRRAP
jgi:acyl carrier protein